MSVLDHLLLGAFQLILADPFTKALHRFDRFVDTVPTKPSDQKPTLDVLGVRQSSHLTLYVSHHRRGPSVDDQSCSKPPRVTSGRLQHGESYFEVRRSHVEVPNKTEVYPSPYYHHLPSTTCTPQSFS